MPKPLEKISAFISKYCQDLVVQNMNFCYFIVFSFMWPWSKPCLPMESSTSRSEGHFQTPVRLIHASSQSFSIPSHPRSRAKHPSSVYRSGPCKLVATLLCSHSMCSTTPGNYFRLSWIDQADFTLGKIFPSWETFVNTRHELVSYSIMRLHE